LVELSRACGSGGSTGLAGHARLHGCLLGRPLRTAGDGRRAAARYARMVASVSDGSLWDTVLRQQIYCIWETKPLWSACRRWPNHATARIVTSQRSSAESRAPSRNGCKVARIENKPYGFARAQRASEQTFALIQRLHWFLLPISLLTIAGAVPGAMAGCRAESIACPLTGAPGWLSAASTRR
jgi:hypothetical protein